MTDKRDWQQIEALFDAAWEHPAGRRRDWLAAQPVNPEWIAQALQWLDATDRSVDFLETTAPAGDAQTYRYSLQPDDRAGPWRVVRVLGRGGMGEVYEVERVDGQYKQQAALKLLAKTEDQAWQRFQIERQVLADLDHPGIARMIDGGLLSDAQPYMVMEFVDGLPIDRWCADNDADLERRVALVIDVCAALAHAHGRLILHRDVKPGNVLVDSAGRARLIDFGVANPNANLTLSETAVPMSMDFAAPEQATSAAATTATDIYGLAATLYSLIAGCPPRDTVGMLAPMALAAIRSVPVAPLRERPGSHRWSSTRRRRLLLEDLEAVLAKAMHPDSSQRYASADRLRDDLLAASHHGVVAARAAQRNHRWVRQLWQRRWWIAATTAVGTSLAIGMLAALWQAREASLQRDFALREQARLTAFQQSIFHMFRSAGELKGREASASDVLNNAAQRIENEFVNDPGRGAAVLHAVGELYFLLTDYEAAKPLLQRLADSTSADIEPELIAAARYDLAQVLLREGNAALSRSYLDKAQAFWNSDPSRWQSRLLDSRLLEAQWLKQEGQVDAAIALLAGALPQRIVMSGEHHPETGVLHNNLGVALFAAGRLDEARAAFRAAAAVWDQAGLQQSPDALNTLNNWGAVELADGKLQAATALLREAVSVRQQNYGPSAATAALLSNYGKLLLQTAAATEALPVLREAAAMGEQFAGRGSLHHIAATSSLVEAELSSGDTSTAEALASAAIRAAQQSLGRDHIGTAMASMALGSVRAAQTRTDEAQTLLEDAERIAVLVGGSSGSRLATQLLAVRDRYRVPARLPKPETTTPSP